MDEELIQYVVEFLSRFYIWEILIILVAIALTMVIKIPISNQAKKLREKYAVDKSMLTWVIALIPYVLCLGMVFTLYWYKAGWTSEVESLDFSAIVTEGLLLGSGAIGLYEAVKKIYKGNKAIQEKKAVKKAQDLAKKPIQLKVKKSKYRVDD